MTRTRIFLWVCSVVYGTVAVTGLWFVKQHFETPIDWIDVWLAAIGGVINGFNWALMAIPDTGIGLQPCLPQPSHLEKGTAQ